MTGIDHHYLAETIWPAVRAAARGLIVHFHAHVCASVKSDGSPVTIADREAEAILLKALSALAPGFPVIAEEAAAAGLSQVASGTYFLVDPLDGTREFLDGRREFTINVGLVSSGRPVFGMIYAPALDALYYTRAGGQSCRVHVTPNDDRDLRSLQFAAITTRAPDLGRLVVLSSRHHQPPATAAFLKGYDVAETKHAGSALKFCLIAEGNADLYPRLGNTGVWDTAAGQAILEAAGGTVTTLDGAPLGYGNSSHYLNPHFVAWGRTPIPAKR